MRWSTIAKHAAIAPNSVASRALGREMRRLRAARGLTQSELGTPFSRGYVSALEAGHVVPSLASLLVLAARLGVRPGAILDELAPGPTDGEVVRRDSGDGPRLASGVRGASERLGPLSRRERDIVQLLIAGRSNDEIATRVGLARKTVEAHLSRLYRRHGVMSRTELAVKAAREEWLEG